MTKQELFNIQIADTSSEHYLKAKRIWDSISKPIDGLGDFEDAICQIAAVKRDLLPSIDKRVLIVFCADNGIVSEGVSQSSQDITTKVAEALGNNTSSACCLAKCVSAKVCAVDVGINCDDDIKGILPKKIVKGTKNFLTEPAMTHGEVLDAIELGIKLVEELAKEEVDIIATGEMGIGNTTTATAVLAALTGMDSEALVGRGAGLDDQGFENKKRVIKSGIAKYKEQINKACDEKEKAFEILSCLGGLDIAAMCGVFIGGALYQIPIVIDGMISAVSALLSQIICPGTRNYMIASHSGREKGISCVLEILGKKPYINGNMALGEGTGALMVLPLIDSALFFYKNGLRFENAGIENYERYN